MNTRSLLTVLSSAACIGSTAFGGPLVPPPGAVAPTMKTLDAIEPRVLLRDVTGNAQCVHRITAPGQYVATADIVVPSGKHGILLDLPPGTTGSVTIDMNGFEVSGQPGSLDGVRRSGATQSGDFNYKNGIVANMGGDAVHIENMQEVNLAVSARQCGGDGFEFINVPVVNAVAINSKAPPPGAGNIVKGMGGHAVRAAGCGEVKIDLTIQDCALDGLHIETADRCDLSFDISGCGGDGVSVFDVTDLTCGVAIKTKGTGADPNRVAGSGGNGVVVTQCDNVEMVDLRVSGSGGGGGGLPGVGRGCVFTQCDRLVVDDCTVHDTTSHGIELADCARSSLTGVRVTDIGGNGIHATATSAGRWIEVDSRSPSGWVNSVAGNGIHISGITDVSLLGGTLSDCGGDGVHIEDGAVAGDKFAQVRGFKVERCAGDGIEVECDELDLSECETRNNGVHGVYAKEIRKNISINLHHSSSNLGHGLRVDPGSGPLRQQGRTTQVTRSNISNNRAGGVSIETAGSLSMEEVEASGNDLAGCDALLLPALGSVQEKAKQVKCRFNGNGFGTPDALPGCVIRGAESFELREVDCSGNAASGLVLADWSKDGRMELVTCSGNGEYGVRCTSFIGVGSGRLRARELVCDSNGFDGLLLESSTGGEVSDSSFTGNGALGVRVLSFNHLVQRSTFIANVGGPIFALLPGNTVAPIVDEGTLPANCNPSANHIR